MVSEPIAFATVPSSQPPHSIGLVHDDERWSWRQLQHRACQWAAAFAKQGVGPDDLVAFAVPNGLEFFAITFGAYMAGATPAPLSPKLPAGEAASILALMAPAACAGSLPGAASPPDQDAPVVDGRWRGHIARSWKACTSGGSTGRPKVIVDARAARMSADTSFLELPNRGVVFVPGPLYHNASFSVAILALLKGSTLVTMPRFDAEMCLKIVEREQVEWALMVPTMMQRILRLDRSSFDLRCWRKVVHTAAPMPPAVKHRWIAEFGDQHIGEAYGATEGLVRTWISGREWLERPGSVGRPTDGARIRILDADGRDCPIGIDGEVFAMPAGGPGSSYRYIGAERRSTTDGWESVGDVGRLDEEGYLYLADRRDDMIVSGGVNIWPAEVEAALSRNPHVLSCAVIGIPNEDLGQHVHAVIEAADRAPSSEELREFLRTLLVPEKIPRTFEFVSGPVRDDAGKVRKSALVRAYLERSTRTSG